MGVPRAVAHAPLLYGGDASTPRSQTRALCAPPPAGGVLQEDWKTPHDHKLEIIARAHPNPTAWPLAGTEVIAVAPAAEDTEVAAEVDPAAVAKVAAPAAGAAAPPPPPPTGRWVNAARPLLKGFAVSIACVATLPRHLVAPKPCVNACPWF